MISWMSDHPEASLALAALAANAAVELLDRLGFTRAAKALASVIPHARGLLLALAMRPRSQSAVDADSDPRPLAPGSEPPTDTNSQVG